MSTYKCTKKNIDETILCIGGVKGGGESESMVILCFRRSNHFKLVPSGTGRYLKALVNIMQTQFKKSEGGDVSCLLVALAVSKNS